MRYLALVTGGGTSGEVQRIDRGIVGGQNLDEAAGREIVGTEVARENGRAGASCRGVTQAPEVGYDERRAG